MLSRISLIDTWSQPPAFAQRAAHRNAQASRSAG
jgi:hypothetical protein